jgi:hypothetical protein
VRRSSEIPREALSLVGREGLSIAELRTDRHGGTINAREELFDAGVLDAGQTVDRLAVRDRRNVLRLISTEHSRFPVEHPEGPITAEPILVRLGQVVMEFRLRHAMRNEYQSLCFLEIERKGVIRTAVSSRRKWAFCDASNSLRVGTIGEHGADTP